MRKMTLALMIPTLMTVVVKCPVVRQAVMDQKRIQGPIRKRGTKEEQRERLIKRQSQRSILIVIPTEQQQDATAIKNKNDSTSSMKPFKLNTLCCI
jgi:hypothetical protein